MLYRNPLNNKEFLKQLDKQKEREVFVKLIALDKKESPLQEIQGKTTGGNVNIDGNSAARRTCSLSMVAQDVDINSFYWGLYNKFKVEIGVKNTVDRNNYDDIIWFPQGVYVITNFSTSQNTNSFNISISGKDKMCLLNGDISGNIPYQTDFGTEEVIEYEYEKINFANKEEYKPSYYYTYNPKTLQYNLSHDSSINENVQYYKRLNGYSTIYRRVPVKEILTNLLHAYAGEPYHNIIIQDLDTRGLELLEYRGEEPLYLTYNTRSGMYTNVYPNSIHCFEIEDVTSTDGVKIHKIDSLQDGDYNSRIDSFTEDGAKEVYLSYIGVLESEMIEDFEPEDGSNPKCGLYLMNNSPGNPDFSYEIIRYNIKSEDDFINNPEIKGIIGENSDDPKDVVYYDENGTYKSTSKYKSGVFHYYKKLYYKIDIGTDDKPGVCDKFTITRLQYGETAGYRLTDLVYPGELIANIGETITSVLDKIKNAFGDFEYFYDLDGRFIWRLKPTFVNTIANGLISAEGDEYADNAVSVTDVEYHFEDGQLITSYSNTPDLQNLRNDYSVWGNRKGVSGAEIPIHMRYAIDTKPKWYRTLHNHIYFTEERLRKAAEEEIKEFAREVLVKEAKAKEIAENGQVGSVININKDDLDAKEKEYSSSRCHLVDWREVIYQMAKDYMQLNPDEEIPDFEKDNFLYYVASNNPDYYPTGITGYEHYYTDILGFWRQLYEPYSESDESGKLIEVTDSIREYINDEYGQKLAYKFTMEQDDESEDIDFLYIDCDLEPIEIKEYNDWYSKIEDTYLNHIENDEPKNLYELSKIGSLNSDEITYYRYNSDDSVINIDLYNVLVEKILTSQEKKEISIDEKWHSYVNNTEKDFLIDIDEINKSKSLNSENIRTYICTFGRHYYLETIENNEVIGVELVKSLIDKAKITSDIYIKDEFGNFELAKDLEDSLDPFSEYYEKVESSKSYQLLTYELKVLENDEEGRTRKLKESCFKKKVTYEKVPELDESTWKNNYYYVEETDEDGYTVYIKKESFETGYQDKWCEKIEEYVAEFSKLDSIVKEFYQGIDGKIVFLEVTDAITDYTKAYIQDSETTLFENYISNYIRNKDDASSFVTISYDKGYKKLDVNHSLYNYLVEEPSDSNSKLIYQTILLLNNTGYDALDSSNQIPITYKYMYYNYFREGDKKYWNKEIIRNPATLNFWFDFLDSEQEYFDKDGMAFTQGSELNSYKVQLIGDRPKVINDKDVTSIYFREVPNLIFDDDNEVTAEEIIDYSGYIRIQGIPYDFFTISAQGKSAKDKIDELIYQHSYCIETINISALPVYYLQPNTRILITDKNSKIDGEYIVSRISYSLIHNGTMSISATKAPTRIY